jgi:hypothetical protein
LAYPAVKIIWDAKVAPTPSVREDESGLVGKVSYEVHTEKVLTALFAAPARGSYWPLPEDGPGASNARNLTLRGKQTRYWARRDTAGPPPTSGGLTIVECEYRSAINGRLAPVPSVFTRWTELVPQTESATVKHAIDPVTNEAAGVINNGDGVAKKVGVYQARVYAFYNPNFQLNLSRLTNLHRGKFVNDANLTLPPIDGYGPFLNFGPGQVQFDGFTPSIVAGDRGQPLRQVVYELTLSDDFRVYWDLENEKGEAIAVAFAPIYAQASLAGLW